MASRLCPNDDDAVHFARSQRRTPGRKGGIVRKMVIIADDLTGALDVVASFAAPEVHVRVLLDGRVATDMRDTDVLSACVETRHLEAGFAKRAVRTAFERVGDGAEILLKKTDSALRGNVGAELEALLEASGAQVVHFIPAFPDMGRTTVRGVHLIDGEPVATSAFGADPLNPVACSRVADIIAATSTVPVFEVSAGAPLPADFSGVALYDAETQAEIDARVAKLIARPGTIALAGCAGLARALAASQGIEASHSVRGCAGDLMVMCGSGNPASRAQCAAVRAAVPSIEVPLAAMTDPAWLNGAGICSFEREFGRMLGPEFALSLVDASSPVSADVAGGLGIDANELRVRISNQLGVLFARLICDLRPSAALVAGGDALLACLRALHITELAPFAEPLPGVVAAHVGVDGRQMVLISKSGGFGGPGLFGELAGEIVGSLGVG